MAGLLQEEWINEEYNFDTIIPGTARITLPGDLVEQSVTIGDKQYVFAGFALTVVDRKGRNTANNKWITQQAVAKNRHRLYTDNKSFAYSNNLS